MPRDYWRTWGLLTALGLALALLFAWSVANDRKLWALLVGVPYFKPGSAQYKELFRRAAAAAGLPEDWADSAALESIVSIESAGGFVGIPNYQWNLVHGKGFSSVANAGQWPAEWPKWRKGQFPAAGSVPGFNSRAIGLGQMQPKNMLKYYRQGYKSIGIPVDEAEGMLRYIADRYGDPEAAWTHHKLQGTY